MSEVRFSRNKQTNEWQVSGPPSLIQVGAVEVTKKGGKVETVEVVSVSKTMTGPDGSEFCFGKLKSKGQPDTVCLDCGSKNVGVKTFEPKKMEAPKVKKDEEPF